MRYLFYFCKFHISAYRNIKLREALKRSDYDLLNTRRKLRVENKNIHSVNSLKELMSF